MEAHTQRERTCARTCTHTLTRDRLHPRARQRMRCLSLALDRAALEWLCPVLVGRPPEVLLEDLICYICDRPRYLSVHLEFLFGLEFKHLGHQRVPRGQFG